MSAQRCCVPQCNVKRADKVALHTFPNPDTDPERFRLWLYNIGGDILALDNQFIYKYRKVCHNHFEIKYHTWRPNTLSPNAVPTLELPGLIQRPLKRPFSDITNAMHLNRETLHIESTEPVSDVPKAMDSHLESTEPVSDVPKAMDSHLESTEPVSDVPKAMDSHLESTEPVSDVPKAMDSNQGISQPDPTDLPKSTSSHERKASSITKADKRRPGSKMSVGHLASEVRTLQRKKEKLATRLKKALNIQENITFQRTLKKFTTLAVMFTLMQFREIGKDKMGRRFTQNEKIMALSLYKQGPRAYRWLSKVFVLPSPLTLRRLVAKAGIKPGINKNIFAQLKIKAQSMTSDEKLCMLLFDEISITPHFAYNNKNDKITGFVTNGSQSMKNIADHALVFMLRGAIKNYKQPIAYTFCHGTTPTMELKMLIKNIIAELQNCGFTVLATVCDQGTTNVSAINALVKDTKEEYLRNNKIFTYDSFEVNETEVIPIFDPPHLIKGLRNNLITKNLKCTIDGSVKTAKWDHLVKLYDENPAYKGIRLMKNLSELHINPKKMPKMKVKYATQVFSKTVASNMGYLATKGILPKECQDTADVLLFFDELFDSMNGSKVNYEKRSGKPLLGPVTPKSGHTQVWIRGKEVLRTMKFITNQGKEGTVPSIQNWIRTLENMGRLKTKIFDSYNFKSIWMRHFNQDPLENFFGSIRSHAGRNTSPTPSGFESAFVSLLINNVTNHSRGFNCEEDDSKVFESMKDLFDSADQAAAIERIEIDNDDILNCEIVEFENKKNNPKIIAQLCYVTGYILRQAKKKVFKNCTLCKECLMNSNNPNEYLIGREYFKFKRCLTYPNENLIKCFSEMQDIVHYIIENKSDSNEIKNYIKTLITVFVNFNFINCTEHKSVLTEFILDLTCRFFLFNWCRDINKILNGTRAECHIKDCMKIKANEYYKRKNKKH